jgi:hypothetical protein
LLNKPHWLHRHLIVSDRRVRGVSRGIRLLVRGEGHQMGPCVHKQRKMCIAPGHHNLSDFFL